MGGLDSRGNSIASTSVGGSMLRGRHGATADPSADATIEGGAAEDESAEPTNTANILNSVAVELATVNGRPRGVSINSAGSGHGTDAIATFDLVRNYGSRSDKIKVLKGLDLTLPCGKIYGLLGPSGCGKTTFLKCVTGRLRAHGGQLHVFGKTPGSSGHSIPGSALGYMPQEEALYADFSVGETLTFFGWVHGLSARILKRRKKFLFNLLELTDFEKRQVGKLSGGQKRRVSFAVALLHRPQLLVLDEPTVGVDPLLRAKIWAYLRELTSRPGGPSILITTHYIEEARQADIVGMMRDGALLAEDHPERLMRQYSCKSLEDVFLLLCRGRGDAYRVSVGTPDPTVSLNRNPHFITYRGPTGASRRVSSHSGDAPDPASTNSGTPELPLRKRLVIFYKERAPEKMGNIDKIIEKFAGREEEVDPVHLMEPHERVNYEREKAALLLEEAEKAEHQKLQSHRWRTDVWSEEAEENARRLQHEIEDDDEAEALKAELLRGVDFTEDADEDDVPMLGIGSWVPTENATTSGSTKAKFSSSTYALTWKNLTKLLRNPPFLLFLFLLPAVQVSLFCLAFGGNPQDLPIAICNLDNGNWSNTYLASLDTSTVQQHAVTTVEEGEQMVRKGGAWGVLLINKGFSQFWDGLHTQDLPRANQSFSRGDEIVQFRLDATEQQVAYALVAAANKAVDALVHTFPASTTNNPVFHLNPMGLVNTSAPIYGSDDPSFTSFVAPGILITIGFAQAIGLTAISFIQDQKDGLLDRCWAAGIHPISVIVAHLLTQSMVLVGQVTAMLFIALFVFKLPMVGSLPLVIVMMLLLGLTGMAYGLVISTVATSEVAAMQVGLGTFFPSMMLSGIIWPLEGMTWWLKYVAYCLPTTWAAESMRSIMLRGWGIDQQHVWAGFVAVVAYITFFSALATFRVRTVD